MKILITLVLFLSSFLFANSVTWLQHQRPPWMISYGDYENQGYGDEIRNIFENRLIEYKHQHTTINFLRVEAKAKRGGEYCYGPVGKFPAWRDLFYWTKSPLYVLTPRKIIMLESTHVKLGSPKELSIQKLIEDKNYVFGHVNHSVMVPPILKPYLKNNNIFSLSSITPSIQLLNMIDKGRVHWMVDFPFLIKWSEKLGDKKNKIISVPIKEYKDHKGFQNFIGCTKTPFGKKIIEEIDKTIDKRTIQEARELVLQWQPDDGTKEEFQKLNKQYFKY